MKFLVLALCVCAASAASFGPSYSPYKSFPQQPNKAFAQAAVSGARTVASAAVVAPKVAYEAAKVVAAAPVVAAKTAYVAGKEATAVIVRSESDIDPEGFHYAYETDNGISSQSSGVLKKFDDKVSAVVIQGSYRYIDVNGTPVEVTYVADENGYRPESNIIPVAPPVPEEIQRSLAFIAQHPQKNAEY